MLGAAMFVLAPTVALAQTSQEPIGLEEIVVTAQKRSENLQNAALAVSAVDGSSIAEAGVTSAIDLTRLVPSLQVGTSNGAFSSYFIRGVGKTATNSQVDSAILVNLDGVSLGRSGTSGGFFFDLERVEVLKGPQGTLYGRNATGGAINIITRKPSFDALGGFIEAEVGNYQAVRTTGAINIPVNDRLALRAAGQVVRHDGYLSDGTQDEESEAARLTASVKLTEDATLLLGADYSHAGGRGPGYALVPFVDPSDRQIGILDPRAYGPQTSLLIPYAGNFLPRPPTNTFIDVESFGAYAQLDIDTPLGALTVLPAYREVNPTHRGYAGQVVDHIEKSNQKSIEARLTSDSDRALKYTVGLYYIDEEIDYQIFANQGYTLAVRNVSLPGTSYAAFARLNYSITDRFRVDGGVRVSKDDKSIDTNGLNIRVLCPAGPTACIGGPSIPYVAAPPPQVFAPNGALIRSQPYGARGNLLTAAPLSDARSAEFSSTTYHAGVEFDLADRSLLYASYDTGFKAGGFFSTIAQDDGTFAPEKIEAYTLGSKNRFFDNRVQLNVEVFQWRYRDQQASFFSLDSQGGTVYRTSNIGQSTLKGVEVDLQVAPTTNTLLSANVQYLDAKNDSFVYRALNLGGPPTTGCPFTVEGRFYVINCSGTRPQLAAEWTMNLGAEQTFSLGEMGKLVAFLSTRYQSETNTGFELLARQVQPGYWTTDASLTYRAPNDRYFVTAFVRNIEDETPFALSNAVPQTGIYSSATLRPPRTYGLRAGVTF